MRHFPKEKYNLQVVFLSNTKSIVTWKNVLDVAASNIHGILWGDT
jgi:hypothetical protein